MKKKIMLEKKKKEAKRLWICAISCVKIEKVLKIENCYTVYSSGKMQMTFCKSFRTGFSSN